MGKRKVTAYGLILLVILLTIQARMPVYAAGSQYGIWCPGCGKWQDHFKGTVESKSITRTEYTDGRIQYSNGEILVSCAECSENLIRILSDSGCDTYNSGTDDESQAWWEDYAVEKCGSGVIFPQMAAHREGDSDTRDSYRVTSDGNILSANGSEGTAEYVFNEASDMLQPLFARLADCLTLERKSSSMSSVKSVYAVCDGEFTWEEWYDSGWKTAADGSGSSALTDYMRKFGIQASRQNSFQVTFYANGGEGTMNEVTVTGGACELPLNAYVRSGYRFLGWAIAPDGLAVYLDGEEISVTENMALYAVWEKEKEPPALSVTGEAEIRIYRNGELISSTVNAGDRVEILPLKKQGREYADYTISGSVPDISWNNDEGKLVFTMPEEDISVAVFYYELRGLEAKLNSLFYETYQKPPYWDGKSFNLDCEPPITVEKEMLEVTAVFYHTGTGENVRRAQTEFTIAGDNRVLNLGENTIIVEADVLRDGYVLRGQCTLQADSVSLKELMEQTGSRTYTELKEFVEDLMQKLAGYEETIEELTDKLALSEEERKKCEEMLAGALADIERLTKELADAGEQLADTRQELETMREQLSLLQEMMQELTGSEQIDGTAVEQLKEKFRELMKENETLAEKLRLMEEERIILTDKISGLENENSGLTDKIAGLEEENTGLSDRITELEEQQAGTADQISGLETDKGNLASKYAALAAEYEELLKEKERLLADKQYLIRSNEELAEQLNYAIEEQHILLGDYELLKKDYSLLQAEKERKEQEYCDKLAVIEESLSEAKKEKEKLDEQLSELEKEKAALKAVWEKEKEEMAASIRKLQEKETDGVHAEELEQTEALKTGTENDPLTQAELIQADPGQNDAISSELDRSDLVHTEIQNEQENSGDNKLVEQAVQQTETADFSQDRQTAANEFSALPAGRRILPGIVLVLAAMLLGGLILYLALEQKEKTVNYTCD